MGIVISNGTDNLILSSFIGLNIVGRYTSYILIFNSIQNILTQAFNAVVSSIANFSVMKGGQQEDKVFFVIQYISFGAAYTISVSLYVILYPFITVWIGSEYHLAGITALLMIVSLFLNINRLSLQSFITAHGLYWETKWKSISEAIVNLVISLLLIKYTNFGVNSVVVGTLCSIVFVDIWWEPMVLFKHGLSISLRKYVGKVLKFIFLFGISILILSKIGVNRFLQNTNIFTVLAFAFLTFVGSIIMFLSMNITSNEQRFVLGVIRNRILGVARQK